MLFYEKPNKWYNFLVNLFFSMETIPKKRGRPRSVKIEKQLSPQPEDLEEILQDMDDEVDNDYDYIPNGVSDYLIVKNRKNINNNEDVYDFDVEKEDGPGISNILFFEYLTVKFVSAL